MCYLEFIQDHLILWIQTSPFIPEVNCIALYDVFTPTYNAVDFHDAYQ